MGHELADAAGPARGAVVLLHPHPDFGGDRHNIMIDALFRALPVAGFAALRFDFTTSRPDDAAVETVAMLDLVAGRPLVLAGYSFGAAAAANVTDERVAGWALIAPPFGAFLGRRAPIGSDTRPKLALLAEHDQFASPAVASTALDGWPHTSVEVLPGADHFLAGQTAGVADRVIVWLESTILATHA